jgi:3',5'-cyclic AMP phosphodiesterase CpdA
MRIYHISDTHIGHCNLKVPPEELRKKLIKLQRDCHKNIVVYTGDLMDDATAKNSYTNSKLFVEKLEDDGFVVLPVPGNHDYGKLGVLSNKKYVKKFKKYFNIESYPVKTIIEEVVFIGLDSMAEELSWDDFFGADGELGKKQLRRLDKILGDVGSLQKVVIYLHHHPFSQWPLHGLRDVDKLKELLSSYKVNAILFGHNHNGFIWNGRWNIPIAYDAGSSTSLHGLANPLRFIDKEEL